MLNTEIPFSPTCIGLDLLLYEGTPSMEVCYGNGTVQDIIRRGHEHHFEIVDDENGRIIFFFSQSCHLQGGVAPTEDEAVVYKASVILSFNGNLIKYTDGRIKCLARYVIATEDGIITVPVNHPTSSIEEREHGQHSINSEILRLSPRLIIHDADHSDDDAWSATTDVRLPFSANGQKRGQLLAPSILSEQDRRHLIIQFVGDAPKLGVADQETMLSAAADAKRLNQPDSEIWKLATLAIMLDEFKDKPIFEVDPCSLMPDLDLFPGMEDPESQIRTDINEWQATTSRVLFQPWCFEVEHEMMRISKSIYAFNKYQEYEELSKIYNELQI